MANVHPGVRDPTDERLSRDSVPIISAIIELLAIKIGVINYDESKV